MLAKKLSMASAAAPAAEVAEAVDFDGTNDYLSRSSDLTGNANGKTFTFSAWIYPAETGSWSIYSNDFLKFSVYGNNNQVLLIARNSSNTNVLYAEASGDFATIKTFTNILVSCDLTNASNRYVYINDVNRTSSFTWTTYTNDTIDFTNANHAIGDMTSGGYRLKERFSNIFLDYTYRDLSVESNRRLFITADLKPADGQASLNPIIYLPMDDPTTVGTNLGTGGNFTLNGTIARSGRGPNQYNAPYSTFDGAADYLSRTTAPTGIADGKQFTFQCVFRTATINNSQQLIQFSTSTADRFRVYLYTNTTQLRIEILGVNSAGTVILNAQSAFGSVADARNYVLTISCDMASSSNRYVYLNGQQLSMTWETYTNDSIDFAITSTPRYRIGVDDASTPGNYFNGTIGAIFFHTSYINLSVASNLAKFVTGTGIDAKPVDPGFDGSTPLGVQPLIYLPMYASNAGKNYGSGGDFTVNSGPYTGARGPNEFWGNKADFDGSTGYLARTSALSGVSNSKTFSCSFNFNGDNVGTNGTIISFLTASNGLRFQILIGNTYISVLGVNSSGTTILDFNTPATLLNSTNYSVQLMVDLNNSSYRGVYINGTLASTTWTTYTNDSIEFSASKISLGARTAASTVVFYDGRISEFYFTTSYIDFSQEANRLKFRDAFGNPVDLGADGSVPTGTAPAVYMRFDPAAQGTNSGSGGNFTKSGTITDGGQL